MNAKNFQLLDEKSRLFLGAAVENSCRICDFIELKYSNTRQEIKCSFNQGKCPHSEAKLLLFSAMEKWVDSGCLAFFHCYYIVGTGSSIWIVAHPYTLPICSNRCARCNCQ